MFALLFLSSTGLFIVSFPHAFPLCIEIHFVLNLKNVYMHTRAVELLWCPFSTLLKVTRKGQVLPASSGGTQQQSSLSVELREMRKRTSLLLRWTCKRDLLRGRLPA